MSPIIMKVILELCVLGNVHNPINTISSCNSVPLFNYTYVLLITNLVT